ncbi:hypothetical protein Q8F55_006053 [Vanrija albida]|uniref:Uncharacterized protein n=1 Tax=Vanrija albida TaxID=181172 RepID=A0ABR3Q3K5_9TREE
MAQYAARRDPRGCILADPVNLLIHLREDQMSNGGGPPGHYCVARGCGLFRLGSVLNLRMPYCLDHLDTIEFDLQWLIATVNHLESDADTIALTLWVYDSVLRIREHMAEPGFSWAECLRATGSGV